MPEPQANKLGLVLGVVALGAVSFTTYQLFKRSEGERTLFDELYDNFISLKSSGKENEARSSGEMTHQDVVKILTDILDIQMRTKGYIDELVCTLDEDATLEQTYNTLKSIIPEDPLVSKGLNVQDFDKLLDRFEHDAKVKNLIEKIMGAENLTITPKASQLTAAAIVEIHHHMLTSLEKSVKEFRNIASTTDSRLITLAAQALCGAQVYRKYGYHPSDVEAGILHNYMELSQDDSYARTMIQMQSCLSELISNI